MRRFPTLLIAVAFLCGCVTARPLIAQSVGDVVATLDTLDSAVKTASAMSAKIRGMLGAPPPVVVIPAQPTPTPLPATTTSQPADTSARSASGLSGKALLFDDYTSYKNTTAFRAAISTTAGGTGTGTIRYTDGANASLASIDDTVRCNGHQTVRYDQPAGTSATPELWAPLPKTLSNAWFRFKIRYSPGWSTVGTTPNSAMAYKIFGWNWAGFNGRGNIVFTNTDEYQVESYVNVNGSAPNFTWKGGVRQTTEWRDGRWYDYIINSEQLDKSRVRTRWWFAPDGQTPVLKYDITSVLDPKYGNAPPVAGVMVGINFNSTRTKAQALWVCQWEAVDGTEYPNPFNVK